MSESILFAEHVITVNNEHRLERRTSLLCVREGESEIKVEIDEYKTGSVDQVFVNLTLWIPFMNVSP